MIIGYARTSRQDLIPENQTEILKAAGAERVYLDRAMSGKDEPMSRPEFREMIEYIRSLDGEEVIVMVYELSRLGRSMMMVLQAVQAFEDLGARVISLSPRESFTNVAEKSIRQYLIAQMAWFAEREREMLIERTRAGLERARREGKRLGRPPVDLDAARINQLRQQGMSYEKIARDQDCSTATITRFIRRQKRADRGLA